MYKKSIMVAYRHIPMLEHALCNTNSCKKMITCNLISKKEVVQSQGQLWVREDG